MYKFHKIGPFSDTPSIRRVEDGAVIPQDPGNRDYQDYLSWVAEGNTTEPADGPTIEDQKADIAAELEAKLAEGVLIGDVHYHTDSEFQMQLTAFVTAFNNDLIPAGAKIPVRTVENTVEYKSFEEIKLIAGTVLGYVQAANSAAWAAKDALTT